MKRLTTNSMGLALALALAACGGNTKTDGGTDGGGGGSADLTMGGGGNADLTMTAMGAATGAACTKPTDCAGVKPACITKDAQGNTWPGGNCTSACDPAKNDGNTGLNPQCPGGVGTCVGQGSMGNCFYLCSAHDGQMPCRTGYDCFNEGVPVCIPSTFSQCDPTKANSCSNSDAGTNKPDGGPDGGYASVCVPVGSDPVGECVPGCDPFRQDCPLDAQGTAQGCYADFTTGAGSCSTFQGGKDGDPCQYLNGCDPGLGCHVEKMAGVCRPYCGGAGNVMCPTGETCNDLSMTVAKTKVGLCGK